MNRSFNLVFLLLPAFSFAQKTDYNLSGKYAAEGYDIVSYFDGTAQKVHQNILSIMTG